MNIQEFIGEYLEALGGRGPDRQFVQARKRRLRAIDFYQGNQFDYVAKKYAKIPNITIVTDNVTRRVVQEWSMVYKKAPDYSSEKLIEVFPRRTEAMKSCERYRNLLGVVLVRPMIRNGKGEHDVIMDFMPFFNTDDSTVDPVAIAYPFSNGQHVIWTEDRYTKFDAEGHILENDDHTYGRMPFAYAFSEYGEWDHSGMNDVVDANLVYDEGLTNLHHTHFFQSFKIPYFTTSSSLNPEDKKIELDVSKPIVLENITDSKIGMLDLQSNFTQSIEVMKFTLDRTLSNYHMRADFDESGNPSSGFSIIARKSGLIEAREAMIPGWRSFEDELYKLEKLVCEKNQIALDKENEVIFKDQEVLRDPKDVREEWDWLIDNGYKRPVDYLIEEKGMSEKEAIKQMEQAGGTLTEALRTPVERV
jgi:hypothetical protein